MMRLFLKKLYCLDYVEILEKDIFLKSSDVHIAIHLYFLNKKCDFATSNKLRQVMTSDEYKQIKYYYPISTLKVSDLHVGMLVYLKVDTNYWAGEIWKALIEDNQSYQQLKDEALLK